VSGNGVHIEFQRSGGFAGLTMRTEVDTSELPPEDAEVFERLVKSLEGRGVGGSSSAGKPDRFQLAEQDLTPEARELVSLLVERARRRD